MAFTISDLQELFRLLEDWTLDKMRHQTISLLIRAQKVEHDGSPHCRIIWQFEMRAGLLKPPNNSLYEDIELSTTSFERNTF